MKQLILKNYFLRDREQLIDPSNGRLLVAGAPSLQTWLFKLTLHGPAARFRNKFARLLATTADDLEKDRLELVKSMTEKDKDGKNIMLYQKMVEGPDGKAGKMEILETTDPGIGTRFKMIDEEAFKKAFKEFMDEDCPIDILPSMKEMVETITKLLTDYEGDFENLSLDTYNEWCDAFENLVVADEPTEPAPANVPAGETKDQPETPAKEVPIKK